jgi:uncharacterized membrane protein
MINLTTIYQLIFFFIVYSIAGWILESIYKSILEKKPINSGFMFGPYCPIYGFGAIIMIALLQNIKSDITLLFIVSFVVLTLWEYVVGVILEKVYHTKYWDYSNNRININGRVCLLNSVYWGILGVVFTRVVHPQVAKLTLLIPSNTLFYIDLIIGLIMIVDATISGINFNLISKKIEELKTLSEKIKEKLEKAKNTKQSKITISSKNNLEEKEQNLMQLQLRHNKLTIALYKQLTRLKKAFPTMQLETANKFLSEKIDIKEIKSKIKLLKETKKSHKKTSKD